MNSGISQESTPPKVPLHHPLDGCCICLWKVYRKTFPGGGSILIPSPSWGSPNLAEDPEFLECSRTVVPRPAPASGSIFPDRCSEVERWLPPKDKACPTLRATVQLNTWMACMFLRRWPYPLPSTLDTWSHNSCLLCLHSRMTSPTFSVFDPSPIYFKRPNFLLVLSQLPGYPQVPDTGEF